MPSPTRCITDPEGMVYSDSRSARGAPPLDAPDPAGGSPLG